jgi:thiazole synthase
MSADLPDLPDPVDEPDRLVIAGRSFSSRLILGTGGFVNHDLLAAACREARVELCTVALRRLDPSTPGSILDVLDEAGVEVLPNTAGCFTARDAVATARLAREAFGTDWLKLEVIGDDRTLLPDAVELVPPPRSWSTTASSCSPTPPTTRCWHVGCRTSAARR